MKQSCKLGRKKECLFKLKKWKKPVQGSLPNAAPKLEKDSDHLSYEFESVVCRRYFC